MSTNFKLNEANASSVSLLNSETIALKLKLAKKQEVISELTKVQIREKSENGYTYRYEFRKLGLIKENRPIRINEVHKFTQKIHSGKYDPELQPIVTIEAVELMDKYNITDLQGNPIPESEMTDYLIVIDGQHRTSAFIKLNSVREDKITIPDVLIKEGIENIREYLADLNTVGHNWDTSDKMCVAAIATENETLIKIHELLKIGFNASAAIYMCTGGRRFTAKQMNDILIGNTSCLPIESEYKDNLLIAEKFVVEGLAIEEMTAKVLIKRYFVRGFLAFIQATSKDEAFIALNKLKINHFKGVNDELMFIQNLKSV